MSCMKYILVVFAVIFISANVYSYETNKNLPTPNNFTVYADTMRVSIMWEAPDSSGNQLLRYNLYRSDIGKYFIFDELPTETYFDYMVNANVDYTYWVTAVYIEGESPPSDSVSATPFPEYDSWVEDFSRDWATTGWEEIPDNSNWQWRPEEGGYAQLTTQPTVIDYDMSLISPALNMSYYYQYVRIEINMYIDNNSTTDGEVWEIWITHSNGEELLWSYDDPINDWGEAGGSTVVLDNLGHYFGDINIIFRSEGGSTGNFECWNIYDTKFDYSVVQEYSIVVGSFHDYYNNSLENVRFTLAGDGKYYNIISDENGSFYMSPICPGYYEVYYYLPGYSTFYNQYMVYLMPGLVTIVELNYGKPIIQIEPDSISMQINAGVTDSMTLTLNNIDMVDSLLWTASIINNSSINSDWIALSDSFGDITPFEELEFQVYFDASNDTVSTTYTCDILFMVNYEVPIVEIPVILEVVNYSVNVQEEFTQILTAYPNPFRTSTKFSFFIKNHFQEAEFEIFNIRGQLVKQFKIKNLKLKINEAVWDGRDNDGKDVAEGIYLYKVKTNKQEFVGKIVKVE